MRPFSHLAKPAFSPYLIYLVTGQMLSILYVSIAMYVMCQL
jgi:hypothetical protein